ncbi:hypothetical protein [Micromonospora sp. NBC_01638]|uniref:hypothetical protein n=1 Tax=Micromonospora sp. NBC_01638 TaxID=2975982 RepID=UPI0038693BFA|nr:hypothetical protein OG811_32080 [Micromonospora sp. NBC_01638]
MAKRPEGAVLAMASPASATAVPAPRLATAPAPAGALLAIDGNNPPTAPGTPTSPRG